MDRLTTSFDPLFNKQKNGLLIFDIDSTIFNVSPRNQAIIDLFSSIYSEHHPLLQETSLKVKLTYRDWGIRPFAHQLQGLSSPEHEKKKLAKAAKSFWNKHFFAGTFLPNDIPYPGILDLIAFFYREGFKIKYLTGRDCHRMRAGTLQQLRHWHLPLDNEADLITKDHKSLLDQDYKRKKIQHLLNENPQDLTFFFDNEASVFENCLFPERAQYHPVFIESTHSMRSQPSPNWVRLNVDHYPDFLSQLQRKRTSDAS